MFRVKKKKRQPHFRSVCVDHICLLRRRRRRRLRRRRRRSTHWSRQQCQTSAIFLESPVNATRRSWRILGTTRVALQRNRTVEKKGENKGTLDSDIHHKGGEKKRRYFSKPEGRRWIYTFGFVDVYWLFSRLQRPKQRKEVSLTLSLKPVTPQC